ncbi:ABC transporter substrate-binding protein [Ursidibacter maritimus]|uniref:ABC transporter substrate-binding protein n=1 Tax=Ursidibacter maritimus TaxID=1331689 RepID=A0A949T528_9PAST|nr:MULTISPECIES: ABC transporter substrate-binding protein [Ursidibacter]KAE9534652.1 ABC transporter substrate-binding protein [Ursidibacter arcticus]KAE9541414.1 ABC transporter substrate-binding protein [Ursidibacter maritimus]MBV6523845.1 ABC transporter substrate-binding protein [Ursidibacter maritimus]MBV6526120.1 ABC transporter substrate-binding protein [Ursidibacter maritimus]MBV6527160.1 ABC transporter substrate-binding protein [Ursidibacter maritimus]
MYTNRRDFLKLLSLFTVAGSAPLLQAQENKRAIDSNAPLRIGYLPITDATPLLVAHAKGLFEKQGIAVEKPVMFRSWAQLVEAFLSGNVNVVHLLSPMSLWAKYGSNAPVKVVMWNHLAGSALTVRPDINSVAELGGKTVAIPFWYSIHNIVLQQLLRANNLSVTEKEPQANEVKLTVMPPSDMVAALASGNIAGFIVAEPFNALAEAKNVGKVLRFSGDVWRNHACCLTLMHEQDVNERPEWVQKVVNALTEAQVFTLNDRLETAKILSRGNGYTPHDQKVLEAVLAPTEQQWANYIKTGAIQHPEWHQERIGFQPYPFDSYMEKLVEVLKETHISGNNAFLAKLDPSQVARDLNAPQFVKKAVEQGGWLETFNLQNGWTRVEEIAI